MVVAKLAGGDVDGAAEAARAALLLHPQGGPAARVSGLVALKMRQWHEAEVANRQALGRDGRDTAAANNLAIALAAQRRTDEARAVIAMAHSLSRGTADARTVFRNRALLEGRAWVFHRRLTKVAWGAFPGVVLFAFFAVLAVVANPLLAGASGCAALLGVGLALRRRVARLVRGERRSFHALPIASGVSVAR
ncbi:MAG TPA: hypothetical protein VF155_04705 [Candidatus Dormibacteraeota bacterium]